MGIVNKAFNELLKQGRNILGMRLMCNACERPLRDGDLVVGEVTGIYRTGVYNGIFDGKERVYHADCYEQITHKNHGLNLKRDLRR